MTSLQELLERAADAEPVRLTLDDVRHRARQRRRTRRALLGGVCAIAVAVGVVAVEQQDVDQVDVGGPIESLGLERRWIALYSNGIPVAPEDAYIEFRDDGTVVGSDGCNTFDGRFTVGGERLVIADLEATEADCTRVEEVALIEILLADPTVTTVGGAVGTLRLGSNDYGFVAFDAAEAGPEEGMIETQVDVEAPDGGEVTLLFRTPRTITVGDERQLLRWTGVNESRDPVTVWADYAFEGLPAACPLGEHHRWEQLEPELRDESRGQLFPQANLEPGGRGGAVHLDDVPDSCRGDFVLVLLATSDPVDGGEVVERRVPFTVR